MEKPASGAGPRSPTPCTTFVQADAATFKELVQRLTGPHDEPHHHPSTPPSRPSDTTIGQGPSPSSKVAGIKRPTFKLQERRQHLSRSKLTILKPGVAGSAGIPSPPPSLSPSTKLSNLLICDNGLISPTTSLELNEEEEEEKAIKERRFYLHPSPKSRLRNAEPELLPLFPLTSPTRNQTKDASTVVAPSTSR